MPQCPHCGDEYSTDGSYALHVRNCDGEGGVLTVETCPFCGDEFADETAYALHVRECDQRGGELDPTALETQLFRVSERLHQLDGEVQTIHGEVEDAAERRTAVVDRLDDIQASLDELAADLESQADTIEHLQRERIESLENAVGEVAQKVDILGQRGRGTFDWEHFE